MGNVSLFFFIFLVFLLFIFFIWDGLYWKPASLLSKTNMGEGDRIVLRSKPNYLSLLHTCNIMSTKIEVEMVVGRVVIPNIISIKGVHPPVLRPRQPQ